MKCLPIVDLTAGSLALMSAAPRVSAQASSGAPPGVGLPSTSKVAARVNTVTLRKDDISCALPRYTGLSEGVALGTAWRTLSETSLLASADVNYCDSDEASLELNYQIDMFGSKIVKKVIEGREISSEAGKYVVVTVSPEAQAGAGWHIADDIKRNRDFSTAIPNTLGKVRAESVGPFVNRYQFWVSKPSDTEVSLVEKFPANKDRMVGITETRNITVGITGTISGKLGFNNSIGGSTSNTAGTNTSDTIGTNTSNTIGTNTSNTIGTNTGTQTSSGPAGALTGTQITAGTSNSNTTGGSTSNTTGGSASNTTGGSASTTVGGSTSNTIATNFNGSTNGEVASQLQGEIQQMNSRTLTYTGTEYTIDNKSSAKMAKWVWDLKLEDDAERMCDYLVKRDLNTCLFTLPLLDTGWLVNTSKFSAASHANFVPTFQAVFKAPPKFAKISTFVLGASVQLASLIGSAQPSWSPNLLEKTSAKLVPGIDGYLDVTGLAPDVLKFSADVRTGAVQSVTESFTVDWDQPYFAPEANIRLQVVSAPVVGVPETNNTLCLSANFDANTAANIKAMDTLDTVNAEGRAAVAAANAAALALTAAVDAEAAALTEYHRVNGDANSSEYKAYLAADEARLKAYAAKTAADEAARRAGVADKVAADRAGLAAARVQTATLETCVANKKEQVWGYDAEEKLLKSRAVKGAEYCLAYQNLDHRLTLEDKFNTTPELNAVEILPCSGLDNRQKWVLQTDGYLGTYTGADQKFLNYDVEVTTVKDKYGEPVIKDGHYVSRRIPHTGMSKDSGDTRKKIQALPAAF